VPVIVLTVRNELAGREQVVEAAFSVAG